MTTRQPSPILDLTRDDHAYFFGFLQTDGHLHAAAKGKKGQVSINLAARDDHILWEFKRLIYPIRSGVYYRRWKTNFAPNGYSGASWAAGAYALRQELISLGLPAGRKSAIVSPPTVPFNQRGYLRGLIDGDGTIGFNANAVPFVGFMSASEALVEFFCQMVMSVTGAVRKISRGSPGMFGNSVTHYPAAKLAGWLYDADCLALDRKRELAMRAAGWRPRYGKLYAPMAPWTSEQDGVIATTTPVAEAAARVGHTVAAVRARLTQLRRAGAEIPDRRQTWTAEDDAIVATRPIPEAAALTGRSVYAVRSRRSRLRGKGVEVTRQSRWDPERRLGRRSESIEDM